MKEESSYNEAWWERELHRNEKLMDRYLAALADNPDLTRLRKREEGPELRQMDSQTVEEDPAPAPGDSRAKEQLDEFFLEAGAAMEEAAEEIMDALEDDEEVVEPNPPNNEGYAELAAAARRFAVAIGSLEPCSEIPEILFLSAPKVGANLAGGHGLGYEEETLCGNIVKCRWALADCEFCREMLEHLVQQTGREVYRRLVAQSVELSGQIRERVTRLRARVWW
jgi:hypothetical protein